MLTTRMLTIDKSHCKLGAQGGDDIGIAPPQRPNCAKLSLRRNYISDAENMLDNFTGLTWLCLSANALTEVPSVLLQLKNLKHLFLSNNKIREIKNLESCQVLETLEIRHNQVEKISGISHLSQLSSLSLSSNRISHLPLANIPTSLTFLGLFGNKVEDLQNVLSVAENMEYLEKLFVGSNPFCNNLPLKETFGVSVSYVPQSNGVKRAKCDEVKLTLREVLDLLKLKCPSLKNIDNNII